LSDLTADPYETENIAGRHPEQVRRLATALRDRLAEVGAPPEQFDRLGLAALAETGAPA
jgi:hypothetical protein